MFELVFLQIFSIVMSELKIQKHDGEVNTLLPCLGCPVQSETFYEWIDSCRDNCKQDISWFYLSCRPHVLKWCQAQAERNISSN